MVAMPRPRLVLDTNVCLDLFVFADPHCAPLQAALTAGAVEAVTDPDCAAEWRAVLAYPQLKLDEAIQRRAMAASEATVRCLPVSLAASALRLPRCADPDDQKFVTLAARAGARWLLSRDRAVLALHRRCLREAGFAILTPQAWCAPVAAAPTQGLSANPV